MKKINWDEYCFRASQISKIAGGTIGITTVQEARIRELENERETGINVNGNKVKFTANKERELSDLIYKRDNPELPKTMQSEVKKIFRSEKYNRNFPMSNKFIVKGLLQEEEAITNYQMYRKQIQGINSFFTKNNIRLSDEFFSGEPDISLGNDIRVCEEGFDIKCSYSLDSFPFKDEPLDEIYECQNMIYMHLTGAKTWRTCYVLVNAPEQLVDNEKKKFFYALGAPSQEDKNYPEYVKKAKEVERMLIFDYKRFIDVFPYHLLEYSEKEWHETVNPATGLKGLDIPLEHRVVEKVSTYDPKKIEFLKERVKIAREYLKSLDKQK